MTDPSNPATKPPRQPSPELRPKVLQRELPLTSPVPELVPARMINEALYCERLMYLEWVQGEFKDNAFTVEGRAAHRRADKARPLRQAKRGKKQTQQTTSRSPRSSGSASCWGA